MAADPTIITENDIRLFLIDKTGDDNYLLDDQEYTPEEIRTDQREAGVPIFQLPHLPSRSHGIAALPARILCPEIEAFHTLSTRF